MFEPVRAAALNTDRHKSHTDCCQLTETLDSAFLDLRGNAADPSFLEAVEAAIGMSPPRSSNTYDDKDERGLFWLGPDQWLIVIPHAQLNTTLSALASIDSASAMALTDISGGYTLLVAEGKPVDALVRSGTGYDVDQLCPGLCAQTVLAKAQVLMWKPHVTEYRILVRRSHAGYLYRWLTAAITNLSEHTND